jgi:prephenate dehydrogenase
MAGGERGGFVHARADLFRGRVCVLTPVAGTSARAVREVTGLWRAAGARVVSMSPRRHDAAAARASHLPHLVAYALVDILRDRDARTLASGSFLDATRVAASDPGLWTSILRANRTQVVRAARDQARRMAGLLREIAAGSPAGLRRALRLASGLRRRAGAAA